MNVLIISAGEDTGGVGIGIVNAFRRFAPDWNVRFVRRCDNYISYPKDVQWLPGDDRTEQRVMELHEQADVIHYFQRLIPLSGWESKKKVIHHHGTSFRRNPEPLVAQAKEYGVASIASTLDLVAIDPASVTWVPNPTINPFIDERVQIKPYKTTDSFTKPGLHAQTVTDSFIKPDPFAGRGTLKIAHAPTSRGGKSTEAFIDAFRAFTKEFPAALDVIERRSWLDCLERKARAHLYYDQVLVGYGNNAVEAWMMGIPVIAGIDPKKARSLGHPIPETTRDLMLSTFGQLPYYEAVEDTILDALRAMTNPDVYREYQKRGMEHAFAWHDGRETVRRLKMVYEAL